MTNPSPTYPDLSFKPLVLHYHSYVDGSYGVFSNLISEKNIFGALFLICVNELRENKSLREFALLADFDAYRRGLGQANWERFLVSLSVYR